MPYTNKESRERFKGAVKAFTEAWRKDGCKMGELNYFIHAACKAYLETNPTYGKYNAVIGALECAKLEIYRRLAVPYEEGKKGVNGDV